eukprot:TRINITY_DN11804_c0_g1_i1.p1 TRINITY_DN11804_c0_g1~~TRINITY_DN11804_c0_g1_i1.p1  ORF type:complete len:82 (+),score=18.59 TRINITY_DN11804_c0_g1_i1:364-609(+)
MEPKEHNESLKSIFVYHIGPVVKGKVPSADPPKFGEPFILDIKPNITVEKQIFILKAIYQDKNDILELNGRSSETAKAHRG